jgi:hypothetical protein
MRKPKEESLDPATRKAAKKAAAAEAITSQPTGCCRFINGAGVNDCIDGLTKAECAKIPNSTFFEDETCV